MNAPMSALQKEAYEAQVTAEPKASEDDVHEINDPIVYNKTDTPYSQKDPDTPSSPKTRRPHGRLRKIVLDDEGKASKTKSLEERKLQFDTKTIAARVESLSSRSGRAVKPSSALMGPFK
jgi:hypothetical protein